MKPTAIISSYLGRAKATAQTLADLIHLPVAIDAGLRETNGGNWEGRTGEENRAADLANFISWIDGDDAPAGGTGERRSEVAERAVGAIERALAQGGENQLLIVATHGGTARCVLGKLLNLPQAHWATIGGLSNAAWSMLQSNRRGWSLMEHNAGSIPEPIYGEESGAEPTLDRP